MWKKYMAEQAKSKAAKTAKAMDIADADTQAIDIAEAETQAMDTVEAEAKAMDTVEAEAKAMDTVEETMDNVNMETKAEDIVEVVESKTKDTVEGEIKAEDIEVVERKIKDSMEKEESETKDTVVVDSMAKDIARNGIIDNKMVVDEETTPAPKKLRLTPPSTPGMSPLSVTTSPSSTQAQFFNVVFCVVRPPPSPSGQLLGIFFFCVVRILSCLVGHICVSLMHAKSAVFCTTRQDPSW